MGRVSLDGGTHLSPAAAFDLPDGAVAVAVTHVLELPARLPSPIGAVLHLAQTRTAEWEGVGSSATAAALGLVRDDEDFPESHVVTTRLVFRAPRVRHRLPLEAADLAFGEWISPLINRRDRLTRRWTLALSRRIGIRLPVTVVGATNLIPARSWDDPDERDAIVEASLVACLTYLNEYIVALAVATGDARLRVMARGDLPVLCPMILEAVGGATRYGMTGLRQIHDVIPAGLGTEPVDDEVAAGAARMVTAARRGEEPFFLFYEVFHSAQAALLHTQFAQAVILLGTASEIMIDTVDSRSPRDRDPTCGGD